MATKATVSGMGLALSGGGVRAMAFHCGVLRWLAEQGHLGEVVHVSSVSGGSLFVGLVFRYSNWEWPSGETYSNQVKPEIRNLLTQSSLQDDALWRLIHPKNWRYLLSRANVLSETIEHNWGVSRSLQDLPARPVWLVNGTTAENGRRFRFKRTECGDYEVGYADAKGFKVADAMAVSAAFPVGIGPYVVDTSAFTWRKLKSWDSPPESLVNVTPPFHRLHLYDGGVYDNLGLEPLFDIGSRTFKGKVNSVVISDAGAPLARISPGWVLSPFRAKRIADIALDQTRALRVRSVVNFLQSHPTKGMYLQLGADARGRIEKYGADNASVANTLLEEEWLGYDQVNSAAAEPTSLKRLTVESFDRSARHGYETARWNELLFMVKRYSGSGEVL